MKKLMLMTVAGCLSLNSCSSSNNEPPAPVQPVTQEQPVQSPEPAPEQPVRNANKTNKYAGTLGEIVLDGTLTFESDKTVHGTFYNVNNSSDIYRVSGTNYVDGEIDISVTERDGITRTGILVKTLTNTHIIWSGLVGRGQEGNQELEIRRLR